MRHIAFTTAGALFAATSISYGLHRAATLIAPSDPPPINVAAPSAVSSPVKVEIDNFTFKPNELSIAVGASVTWVNRDDVPRARMSRRRSTPRRSIPTTATHSNSPNQASITITAKSIST